MHLIFERNELLIINWQKCPFGSMVAAYGFTLIMFKPYFKMKKCFMQMFALNRTNLELALVYSLHHDNCLQCYESYPVTPNETFITVYFVFICLEWFSNWLNSIRVNFLLIRNAPVAISYLIEIRDMFFFTIIRLAQNTKYWQIHLILFSPFDWKRKLFERKATDCTVITDNYWREFFFYSLVSPNI